MRDRTSFIFNGKDSKDFYLYIENDVLFPSPKADVELVEIAGRDGELAIDNKRLKGVDFSLPVVVKPPSGVRLDQLASEISAWLKVDLGWKPLVLGTSSDYEYVALPYHAFDLRRTIMNHGRTVLNFRLKPYKYVRNQRTLFFEIDQQYNIYNEGITLFNNENASSEPVINIIGQGDINFTNNGYNWFGVRDADIGLTVDSELQMVRYNNKPAYNRFIPQDHFPKLHVGENKIRWSGTGRVQRLDIDANWRSII